MNALFICILWDLNAKDEIVTLRMYSWQPPAGRKAKCWKFVLAVSFCSMQIHVTFFQWWLLTPFCTSLLSDFGEIASLLTEMQFHLCSFFFLNLLYKVTVNMKAMYLGKLTAGSVHRICGMLNKCWLPPLFPLLQFQLLLLLLFVFRSTLLAPFFSLFLNFTFLIWFFQFYL